MRSSLKIRVLLLSIPKRVSESSYPAGLGLLRRRRPLLDPKFPFRRTFPLQACPNNSGTELTTVLRLTSFLW